LDPGDFDYPKQLQKIFPIEQGLASCCSFNRRGKYLAVGNQDGTINIWDFETHSIIKQLIYHNHYVNSVSWSRNSRKLLSSDNDGNLILWNLIKLNMATVNNNINLTTPTVNVLLTNFCCFFVCYVV